MKSYHLHLSRDNAATKLRRSLKSIASSANKITSEMDCYGDVTEDGVLVRFTIGIGPTNFTTAQGTIKQIDDKHSQLEYSNKGPWLIGCFDRISLNTHIHRLFKNDLVTPQKSDRV